MSVRRCIVALGLIAFAAAAQPQSAGAAADPLFVALGGRPGIASLVDDFVPRLAADARIGRFFQRSDPVELKRLLVDQFCVVAGGPCVYDGATMKKAHADLNIGKADFNRLVELLQLSMDARAIPFAEQNRLLARLAPMHRDIVER